MKLKCISPRRFRELNARRRGEEPGGASDGGNRDFVDALNDALHDEAEIEAAFGEQACGVGVRIYRREVTKIVGTGEVGGIAPVEEIELDGGAVGLTSTGHYTCCQQRLASKPAAM